MKGAITISDSQFDRDFVADHLVSVISNTKQLKAMSKAAKGCGNLDGTQLLLKMVKGVLPA